jgi:co-chaperonin GroES (HSP10)
VKITPRNGFLLVEHCEDPFDKGPLSIVRDQMVVQYGRVVAVGAGSEGEYRRTFQPGDIVFFMENAGTGIVVDREELQVLVNETVVVAYIPAAEAAGVKSVPMQSSAPPSGADIVVPASKVMLN